MVKNLLAIAGDLRGTVSIPGSGRSPGGGHGYPVQYSCLENSHGQGNLVGYSPRGCKESDLTEATYHIMFLISIEYSQVIILVLHSTVL